MNIIEEDSSQTKADNSKSSFLSVVIIFFIVALVALFINEIFFSKNSLPVYQKLTRERDKLSIKIEELKLKNAQLHKEYFNLISIMPSNEDNEDE